MYQKLGAVNRGDFTKRITGCALFHCVVKAIIGKKEKQIKDTLKCSGAVPGYSIVMSEFHTVKK